MAARAAILLFTAAVLAASDAGARERVYSLDQCADQYVLALVPRREIAALSPRVDDADSYLRRYASGLPQGRAALEPVLASGATVAVRYWGGDEHLTAALRRRGIRVLRIEDATDFDGVRRNIRSVSISLGAGSRGEALVRSMDRRLAAARHKGKGEPAHYLTSGGFTAGQGTLIGAMLQAAGWRNAAGRAGYYPIGLERLVLSPPQTLVLGYFDAASLATQRWAFGRHKVVRRLAGRRPAVALPSTILGCPAWFAADGAGLLASRSSAR